MSSTPHISVVMPAYNAEQYLPSTLRSILSQTFSEFELIVVDDGSEDRTAAIIDEFAAADPRVVPVHLPENRGRSAARNAALDLARGEWVCPTDADDLWSRSRLSTLVVAARAHSSADAFTDDLIDFTVDAGGAVSLGHRYVSRVSWRVGGTHALELDGWFRDRECHMRAMVRRELLERRSIRFPEQLSSGEDVAFYLQIAFAPGAPAPIRVAEPNYYYRVGQSTRAANMAESRVRVMDFAVAATGSDRLARLAEETNPAYTAIYRRADRMWAAEGRSGARDEGSDEVELEMDPLAGYRQLVFIKALEVLGRRADRHLRPGILADVTAQLAAGTDPSTTV